MLCVFVLLRCVCVSFICSLCRRLVGSTTAHPAVVGRNFASNFWNAWWIRCPCASLSAKTITTYRIESNCLGTFVLNVWSLDAGIHRILAEHQILCEIPPWGVVLRSQFWNLDPNVKTERLAHVQVFKDVWHILYIRRLPGPSPRLLQV